MNAHVSPSIIMRIKEFGESDLLVTFFTSDRGRLKGIAKGARMSRRRFANCLDLFCLTNLEYELKRKGDLHFLHSCKLINGFPGVRDDFSSLSLASYMIELTEIPFPLGVVDQNMFGLLEDLREIVKLLAIVTFGVSLFILSFYPPELWLGPFFISLFPAFLTEKSLWILVQENILFVISMLFLTAFVVFLGIMRRNV